MSQPCLPIPRKRRRDDGRSNDDDDDFDEPGDTDFDNIESMDATEYLTRVMRQAKAMPDVFVAENNPIHETVIPKRLKHHVPIDGSAASLNYLVSGKCSLTAPPTSNHLPHNQKWVDTTLSNFEKLRCYLENCKAQGIGGKKTNRIPLPPMKDRSGWHLFCVGKDEAQGNFNSYFGGGDDDDYVDEPNNNKKPNNDDNSMNNDDDDDDETPQWQKGIPPEGHHPSVRLVTQMDQVLVRKVLSHLCYYICQGWSPFTPQRSAWIYALLARLEKPVHRDDAAVLFGLLKVLTRKRAGQQNIDNERDKLAKLNVLITIVGLYFEQGTGKAAVMTYR